MPSKKAQLSHIRELGELLVRCRTDRNLKLIDVQKATGLSTGWLSELETGKKQTAYRISLLRLEKFLREHGYFVTRAA